jgi:hypothetical protein
MAETLELSLLYRPGTQVEVFNHFTDRWARGFSVEECVSAGYRLRRLSDGATLPTVFGVDQVRGSGPAHWEPASV